MLVLFLVVSALSASAASAADDLLSCSGYVHVSDGGGGGGSLDLSRVEVALFTERGSKRDATDLAPSSGYFFLPVEKGAKYLLKVIAPEGWIMDPPQVELTVDGETDPCSRHEDIHFHFKGFSVSGSVQQQLQDEANGGSGDLGKISLTVSRGTEVVQRAVSGPDGRFVFAGLMPGDYVVRLTEESLKAFSFKAKERKVTVKDGSVELEPFLIMGFDVEGSVADSEGNPVDGVPVTLVGAGGKTLATVKSDKYGKFVFASVPRGSYTAKVQPPRQMSFEQTSQDAKVFDKNVALPAFRMSAFELQGEVMMRKGQPAGGVVVRVLQKGRTMEAVTNENGVFTAKSGCICEMSLLPITDEAAFEKTTLNVGVNTKLPTLFPTRFRASGSVEGGEVMSGTGLRVAFLDGKSKKAVESAAIDAQGKFSAFLPPGTYTPEVRNEKGERESVFTSKATSFEVKDAPAGGIAFQVARFSVAGVLKCFNKPCNGGVEILLRPEGQQGDENTMEGAVREDGGFAFREVPFGRYELELRDDTRCWQNPKKRAVKVDRDHSGIEFVQKGTRVAVDSSHATILLLTDRDSQKVQTFQLAKGRDTICVDGDGEMDVSANGCYQFSATPKVVNSKTESLTLRVASYKVTGSIAVTGEVKDAVLNVKSSRRPTQRGEVPMTRSDAGYDFHFFIKEDEEITLTPTSREAFFAPQELVIRPKPTCEENVVSFTGKRGLFVEGRVVPAVEGVRIRVASGGDQETTTGKDGAFRIGPFADDGQQSASRAELTAEKDGYSFEATDTYGVFKSQVLSSITIRVVDEKGAAIPDDAVVSVSSGKSFRSSSHLSDGSIRFSSLLPGEYFAKVFLKEYTFEPKHVLLELKEDSHLEQKLVGKRVAYSLYGQVNYLGGKPASGVVVLAEGREKCAEQIEDASSDAAGAFRLRGLQPGCRYELRPGNPDAHNFMMAERNVTMSAQDRELGSPILAQEAPVAFNLGIKVHSPESARDKFGRLPDKVVSREVTIEARSGNKVVNERYTLEQDLLFLARPLPARMGTYTIILDRGGAGLPPKQIVNPAPGSFHFVEFQLKDETRNRKGNNASVGGNLYALSVLIAAGAAGFAVYKRTAGDKR